jgi:hypothetical protein
MKELASLHDKHLNRPTLDDSSEEEHAIEITTQEITQVRAQVGLREVGDQPSLPMTSSKAPKCLYSELAGGQFPGVFLSNLQFSEGLPEPLHEVSACVCNVFLGGVGTIFQFVGRYY